MNQFVKNNKNLLIGLAIGVLGMSIIFYYINSKNNPPAIRNCSFQMLDVKEYKGSYGVGQSNYFVYEGLIKNTSDKTEQLKAVIAKLYSSDNVYIGEGYTSIGELIGSDISMPFKVQVMVSTLHDTVLRKYFDENDNFRADVYPWFTTCK